MAYLFYTLLFFFLVVATALYATRTIWKPHAPPIPYITAPGPIPDFLYNLSSNLTNFIDSYRYSRVPSNFHEDAEAGLHSSNFDLAGNIEAEDSRRGLDEDAKREVYIIMKRRGVGFDEARRLWVERKFGREGIAADGRPLDRKAVMFS
ncbi:related to protein precursor [Ramularia collo-cygni]|uniref:Related to protein n=1 Tax=Ramularia collo-cygni TaxID=112498 RepID=A0A2D3UY91_9PEZI|nr:related to protein precursor [Ramularia collo-cygni]CZT21861.1 related to protein precursor [Ramularia collo-cygni]